MTSGLVGRGEELAALDRLLEAVREGVGHALVVRGEPGVGKTALLEYLERSAAGIRVERFTAVESELALTFSAVQHLLAPMLERMGRLPPPLREALAGALRVGSGSAPEVFLVGLAVLTLLEDLASKEPLLCVIDDAHWLDPASAEVLAVVARRLELGQLGLVFAVREGSGRPTALEGIPVLRLEPLAEEDAGALLAAAGSDLLDRLVADRIVAEAHGNPLALLDLHAGLTSAQRSGTAALPDPLQLGPGRLQEALLERVRTMPDQTRELLVLAAAAPAVDASVLWRAAAFLGLADDTAAPAEADGLLRVGAGISFRHPLVRTAVYDAADGAQRRRVHAALAEAIDPVIDPDRRAWHLAAATTGPSESVAAELERAEDRARARSGNARVATLLERAAELTPEGGRRAERGLAAARAHLAAGALVRAANRLAATRPLLRTPLERAEGERLGGALAFELGMNAKAHGMLLRAARAFEPLDLRLARDTHLEALVAAVYSGSLGTRDGVAGATRAALRAPPAGATEPTAGDVLLDGLAVWLSRDHGAAMPALRRAVDLLREGLDLRLFPHGCLAATALWDDDALAALTMRGVRLAREDGALFALSTALRYRAGFGLRIGRLAAAEADLVEASELAAACRTPGMVQRSNNGRLMIAAWRGDEAMARTIAEGTIRDAATHRQRIDVSYAHHALAVLELGLGDHEAALASARKACDPESPFVLIEALPELVEAAARSGEEELARAAAGALADLTLASGSDWALGMLARSRALTFTHGNADALYEEAIDCLARCRITTQLARTRLLYGEWLRRKRRRPAAREQLRAAADMFESMGLDGFADRAATELLATGVHEQRPSPAARELLTPQELRIARLAEAGASNQEIASQLFVSPRTIEYHLHKVFRKLGLSSRLELLGDLGTP